eukprot:TRINITY_DN7793_c0_g1_i1.p1 TRINITY_DN7793_c0_g1~~TRINITY_DN7793_c0_g1_i1.p1  ORF type:complete len:253 (+),score=49.42 TRINITY_DN7793_c0_g1_i1:2-760(+)
MAARLHAALAQFQVQSSSRQACEQALQAYASAGSSEDACRHCSEAHLAMIEALTHQHESLVLAQRAIDRLIDAKRRKADPFYTPPATSFSALLNAMDTSLKPWPASESLPPLCGGVPLPATSSIPIGHQVAAYDGSLWLLGLVVAYDGSNTYTIEDLIDDQESDKAPRLLTRSELLPLPFWQPPWDTTAAFYPVGSAVLALYPQTTCFYPAEVSALPTQDKPTYTLHFDDDDYEDGRVRFQEISIKYVVPAR